ncbi:MAG: Rrf2 family transcriptional regulator [Gemmatimonadota bacterium]|nr:Rrf2 family transcriptional regulator [Gemmatimonadota bacterium]MDH5758919.1 Rrf2 family transcriptional regulator [Gemmatimonadota bacterium]
MLSRTGLYALQAVLYLVRQSNGDAVAAATMAADLGVPPNYLAKVLNRMARSGMLTSTRGAHGGFRLASDPGELSVEDVVGEFEELLPLEKCLLGGGCDPTSPCSAHRRRVEWHGVRRDILRHTPLLSLLGPQAVPEDREVPHHRLVESMIKVS